VVQAKSHAKRLGQRFVETGNEGDREGDCKLKIGNWKLKIGNWKLDETLLPLAA
jgi:hypothetical protein